jgi:predicted RNase H-like nuclease (RuvC/YqgF family)
MSDAILSTPILATAGTVGSVLVSAFVWLGKRLESKDREIAQIREDCAEERRTTEVQHRVEVQELRSEIRELTKALVTSTTRLEALERALPRYPQGRGQR